MFNPRNILDDIWFEFGDQVGNAYISEYLREAYAWVYHLETTDDNERKQYVQSEARNKKRQKQTKGISYEKCIYSNKQGPFFNWNTRSYTLIIRLQSYKCKCMYICIYR